MFHNEVFSATIKYSADNKVKLFFFFYAIRLVNVYYFRYI